MNLGISGRTALVTGGDSGIGLKRRGTAEEESAMIALVCSDLASFVNGSDYRVDGGSVMTI